jgi:hypothetical protein
LRGTNTPAIGPIHLLQKSVTNQSPICPCLYKKKLNTIFKHFVLIQKLSNLDEIIQVKSKSCHVHLIFPEKQILIKTFCCHNNIFFHFFKRHFIICKRQTVASITVNITNVKITDENTSIVNIVPE